MTTKVLDLVGADAALLAYKRGQCTREQVVEMLKQCGVDHPPIIEMAIRETETTPLEVLELLSPDAPKGTVQ